MLEGDTGGMDLFEWCSMRDFAHPDCSVFFEDIEPTSGPGYSYAPRSREIVPQANAQPAPAPSFDNVMAQLSTASFGYSWPDVVNVEERFPVRLMVNPSMTAAQIRDELSGAEAAVGEVRISRVLIARLSAPDFEVEALAPERQAVDAFETTEWEWMLTPLDAGPDKEIAMTIIAVVEVGPDRVERRIKTYEGLIRVDVTRRQQLVALVQQHWQWAFSALLVPAGAWLFAKWRRRRTDKKEPPRNV